MYKEASSSYAILLFAACACYLSCLGLVAGGPAFSLVLGTNAARRSQAPGQLGRLVTTAGASRWSVLFSFRSLCCRALFSTAWWQGLSLLPVSALSIKRGAHGRPFSFCFPPWLCHKVLQGSCKQAGKRCESKSSITFFCIPVVFCCKVRCNIAPVTKEVPAKRAAHRR